MTPTHRNVYGLLTGMLIAILGGLMGLGGAEFRLPVLVAWFGLATLPAIILNKVMSLWVVSTALCWRASSIPPSVLFDHAGVIVNVLAGTLCGAWMAAGHAIRLAPRQLDRVVLVLLLGLALLLCGETWLDWPTRDHAWIGDPLLLALVGWGAGVVIGSVAALLGVAGGELLIPTLTMLYGVDIKLAGSLSLTISLPTMLLSLLRYRQAAAFAVLRQEWPLLKWMALGSLLGTALGSALLGLVASRQLTGLLALLLLISAYKVFRHRH